MTMTSIQKRQFAKPNYIRFYLADEVFSLPIGNPYLRKYNKDSQNMKEQLLQENKFNMLKLGNKAILRKERLRIWKAILLQLISYYQLNSAKRQLDGNFKKVFMQLPKIRF